MPEVVTLTFLEEDEEEDAGQEGDCDIDSDDEVAGIAVTTALKEDTSWQ